MAEPPEGVGSHDRPEITDTARTYHLRHSRDPVNKSIERVQHLRHFLLFRISGDGMVEIGRVLHDAMDLERNLPEGSRQEGRGRIKHVRFGEPEFWNISFLASSRSSIL